MVGRKLVTVVAGAALLLAGVACESGPKKRPDPLAGIPKPAGPTPPTLEGALLSDACDNRLHDIAGAMLAYYMVHRDLPAKFDDLRSLGDLGIQYNWTCPTTGQPYVYEPAGLHAVKGTKYIVVYDAAPHADGKRNVIFTPEAVRGTTRSFEVLAIPEGLFRTFHPPTN